MEVCPRLHAQKKGKKGKKGKCKKDDDKELPELQTKKSICLLTGKCLPITNSVVWFLLFDLAHKRSLSLSKCQRI